MRGDDFHRWMKNVSRLLATVFDLLYARPPAALTLVDGFVGVITFTKHSTHDHVLQTGKQMTSEKKQQSRWSNDQIRFHGCLRHAILQLLVPKSSETECYHRP